MSLETSLREMIRDELRPVVREELRAALCEAVPARQANSPEFLSTAEAAAQAGVRPAAVRAWVGKGQLRAHRAGRELRIARADLLAYMRQAENSDGYDRDRRAREIVAAVTRGRP